MESQPYNPEFRNNPENFNHVNVNGGYTNVSGKSLFCNIRLVDR